MGLPQVQLVKNLSVYFRMNGRDTLVTLQSQRNVCPSFGTRKSCGRG